MQKIVDYTRKELSRIFQIKQTAKQKNSHVRVKTQQIIISDIQNYFTRQESFEQTKFFRFESHMKKIKLFSLLFVYTSHSKPSIFSDKFCN